MSKVQRHAGIYFVGRIGPAFINIISTAIFTRIASPTEYAVLVLAVTSAQLGSAALFQWLRQSLLRLAPTTTAGSILGTMGGLYLFQAILASLVVIIASTFFAESNGGFLLWFVCLAMLLAQAWFDFSQELQRSSLQPVNYSLTFATRSILGLVLGSVAILMTGNGHYLASATALSLAVAPFAFSGGVFKHKPVVDRVLMRDVISYGWPLSIALLMTSLATMGDRFIIALLLDAEAVGVYGPSSDLAKQTIFVLVQGIALAGYPLAIRALEEHGVDAARAQLTKNFELLVFIALPATAGLVALRQEVSLILLGPQYRETAITILPLIALGSFAMCLRSFYFDHAMQLGKNTKGQIGIATVICCVSVSLNFLLIPAFGLTGAAAANLVSQWVGLAVSIVLGRRYFDLPFPIQTSAQVALSTVCMVCAILAMQRLTEPHSPLSALLVCMVAGFVFLACARALRVRPIMQLIKKNYRP